MMVGKIARIYIPSGNPEELLIIRMPDWAGEGYVFHRALLSLVKREREIRGPGIYVIWGPSEWNEGPSVYIGEGDNVLQQLEEHEGQKEFWTHAAVFTSKSLSLDKAQCIYIKARLVALASEVKRAKVENENSDEPPSLFEADRAEAEVFLRNMLICLHLVGANFFVNQSPSTKGFLFAEGKGIKARGIYGTDGLTVLAGSQVVKEPTPSLSRYIRQMRLMLLEQGVLVDRGTHYEFTQDHVFKYPSTAASVVLGRSANGFVEWKDENGFTLREILENKTASQDANPG
ncbi:MAG: GIY-YIG nuclease family protein [Sandaracinaceae bacterium]|nr:GIY-YIG nuclease family protein [Sandaracinaceae bacterium]